MPDDVLCWPDAARLFGKTQTHSGRPWPNKPCPLRMYLYLTDSEALSVVFWPKAEFRPFPNTALWPAMPKRKCDTQILVALHPQPPAIIGSRMQIATNCYAKHRAGQPGPQTPRAPNRSDRHFKYAFEFNRARIRNQKSVIRFRFRFTCVSGITSHTSQKPDWKWKCWRQLAWKV